MPNETNGEIAAATMVRINRAWLDGRIDELEPLVHPEIVMVFPGFGGRIQGRDQFLAGFHDFCSQANVHEFREHDQRVDVAGRTAVVSFQFEMVYERSGERYRLTGAISGSSSRRAVGGSPYGGRCSRWRRRPPETGAQLRTGCGPWRQVNQTVIVKRGGSRPLWILGHRGVTVRIEDKNRRPVETIAREAHLITYGRLDDRRDRRRFRPPPACGGRRRAGTARLVCRTSRAPKANDPSAAQPPAGRPSSTTPTCSKKPSSKLHASCRNTHRRRGSRYSCGCGN